MLPLGLRIASRHEDLGMFQLGAADSGNFTYIIAVIQPMKNAWASSWIPRALLALSLVILERIVLWLPSHRRFHQNRFY